MRHEKARYYYNDSGEFADCYTVVFSKSYHYGPTFAASYVYASMNEHPQEPNGFWQHGEKQGLPIDNFGKHRADYAHLGKRIAWSQLPQAIRTALEQEANQ